MGKLDFALWDSFPVYEMARARPAEIYEEHIREAQLAEELGYQSYYIIEHQNSHVGQITSPTVYQSYYIIEHQNSHVGQITSPTVYLTAVAQRTSTLRVGVMIYQLPFYNPVRLAQEAAMLDQLSEGRLEFGTGIGVHEHEFMRWNLPFHERQRMSSEALDIIVKAWTEETVTYEGNYWTFDEALPVPKPYQQPHPPIWVGGHSPASMEYAARNNYHISQNLDVDTVVAEKFDLYRKIWRECQHPGPMPLTFLVRAVHVAETDEIARAEAEEHLLTSRGLAREGLVNTRIGFRGNSDSPTSRELARVFEGMGSSYDFWIDNGLALVGSPDTVIQKLKEQRELIGYDIFCANHRFGPLPAEKSLKSMRLFGEEVIPAFAE
jgi:alkanesulfonate monooxygenase SsuD/methylene tetrahydromethanopterin reductase-like flavin-dependent oxidoreductase (luciferase family)